MAFTTWDVNPLSSTIIDDMLLDMPPVIPLKIVTGEGFNVFYITPLVIHVPSDSPPIPTEHVLIFTAG